jgi:hypothetical protein
MSRFRSQGRYSDIRYHNGTDAPDFSAPSGTIAFNVYNDAYIQADRPAGRNWVRIQNGYRPPILVHSDNALSSITRPMDVLINGTKLVDDAAATNIPADPNDLIKIIDYSTSGDFCRRVLLPNNGNDTSSRFTACHMNVGGPFRIIKMGFYTGTNLNGCTTINGKFGIYQAATFFDDNAMPWKIYPKSTLSFTGTPAVSTKYTCSWDAQSVPPVINSEKFFVRSYWNTAGGAPEVLSRLHLNISQGQKGDRFLTYGSDSYTSPDWTTVYDYTTSVGSPDGGSTRSGVLFWFLVELV